MSSTAFLMYVGKSYAKKYAYCIVQEARSNNCFMLTLSHKHHAYDFANRLMIKNIENLINPFPHTDAF